MSLPSPDCSPSQRSDAVANRERVLRSAARAIVREGTRVPMATIAEGADVGVGTVYRHFPTREDLLEAVHYRSIEHLHRFAQQATAAEGPVMEALEGFFNAIIEHRAELVLPQQGLSLEPSERTRALRRETYRTVREVLKRGQQEGVIRPDVTASDVLMVGALLTRPLPHVAEWDRAARRLAWLFLGGLAAGA